MGIDEAGRGPLAGPVTAAAVSLPETYTNSEINDSKKLSEQKREKLFEEIITHALAYSVVSVGPRRIETINIREATRLAMRLAADRVARILKERYSNAMSNDLPPLHLVIDGNVPIDTFFSQETIIKGDEKVLAIQAASILAKVTRDRLMLRLESRYPGYGFSVHKGYPTAAHLRGLAEKGPCRVHRRTFAGVKEHFPQHFPQRSSPHFPSEVGPPHLGQPRSHW